MVQRRYYEIADRGAMNDLTNESGAPSQVPGGS